MLPDFTRFVRSRCAGARSLLVSQGQSGLRTRCRIANCFDAEPSDPPYHALRLRLLGYFSWAFDSVAERAFLEGTERALGHFSAWGYPVALTRKAVSQLLDDGLLAPTDGEHAADGHTLPKRIRLSASGYVHLTRLSVLPTYRAAMACQTNWYDRDLAESFVTQSNQAGGEQGATVGDIAVSPALGFFETYLAGVLAREDARLSEAIEKQPWVGEVRARAAGVSVAAKPKSDPPVPVPVPPPSLTSTPSIPASEPSSEQLSLALSVQPAPPPPALDTTLPTIRSDRAYHGTKWIPRLLWALEWAKRNKLGPQSPADMARVLKAHGEIDVPHNNVARAFRELRGEDSIVGLWRGIAKRYVIEEGGSMLLRSLLEEDQHASQPNAKEKRDE